MAASSAGSAAETLLNTGEASSSAALLPCGAVCESDGFQTVAGTSASPSASLCGPVRRSSSAAMLLRQFDAASARSAGESSTWNSFSAAAKVCGVTTGPAPGAVPKTGGAPAGAWLSAALCGTCAPAAAAIAASALLARKLRRDDKSGIVANSVSPHISPVGVAVSAGDAQDAQSRGLPALTPGLSTCGRSRSLAGVLKKCPGVSFGGVRLQPDHKAAARNRLQPLRRAHTAVIADLRG